MCATMNLAMPQSDTTYRSIDRISCAVWLRRTSQRLRILRLRRRGPRWMLVALLLLLAGDFMLAALAWLIVENIVR